MKRLVVLLAGMAVGLMLAVPALAQDYDLVINNGRVMDPETMYDAVANVGIKDGIIAIITKDKIVGKRSIDAKGLVVAPGFIDTHQHGADLFTAKMALRDGCTTNMDLEGGAFNVGAWYEEKARAGWPCNYGVTSSLNMNRLSIHDPEVKISGPYDQVTINPIVAAAAKDGVVGWSVTKSSVEQMNQIMRLLDEDLRQGAIGIGSAPAYTQVGVTSYEMYEVQHTAARYGRLTAVHTRYHMDNQSPTEAPIALDEVLVNAMVLDAPLLLCHDNDYGWWENEDKLKRARAKGYNVWGEYYPYSSGSTVVSAEYLQPDQWEAKLGYKYEETIYDPQRDKWLDKAAFLDLVKRDPGQIIMMMMPYRDPWMPYWLKIPHMVVASDGVPGVGRDGKVLPWDAPFSAFAGHPRTAGTFAKVLRLGREQGVPLMFSLSQLSYWTALHLGDAGLQAMKDRGRVQVGKVADLTLFDPATVKDNSVIKVGQNGLPSTGIPYVIVSGTVVVDNNEFVYVKPGKAIRYPVEEKGRVEPVEKETRIGEFSIKVPDIHMDDTGAGSLLQAPKKDANKQRR